MRESACGHTRASERASERAREMCVFILVEAYSEYVYYYVCVLMPVVLSFAPMLLRRAALYIYMPSYYYLYVIVVMVLESYSEGDGKDGVGADVGLVGRPVHLVHLCEESRLD